MGIIPIEIGWEETGYGLTLSSTTSKAYEPPLCTMPSTHRGGTSCHLSSLQPAPVSTRRFPPLRHSLSSLVTTMRPPMCRGRQDTSILVRWDAAKWRWPDIALPSSTGGDTRSSTAQSPMMIQRFFRPLSAGKYRSAPSSIVPSLADAFEPAQHDYVRTKVPGSYRGGCTDRYCWRIAAASP
jgi:hypothetical protein